MGDRGQVFFEDMGLCFYTHWGGGDLPKVLKSALIRGQARWFDSTYLARIIFCEMVKGQEMDLLGYGIGTQRYEWVDNEDIVVNVEEQRVTIGNLSWKFDEYVKQSFEE